MELHPLVPHGIDRPLHDDWRSYLVEEVLVDRQKEDQARRREEGADLSYEELRDVAKRREQLSILASRIRSTIAKMLEKKIDVEPASPTWQAPSLVEEAFEDQRHDMLSFLGDQLMLEEAIQHAVPDGIGSGLHRLCILPAGTVDEIAALLPNHPRFRVYVERYVLESYRKQLLSRIFGGTNGDEWKRATVVWASVEYRIRYCASSRAEETGRTPDDPDVLKDIAYEQTRMDEWLSQEPTLKAAFWGLAARIAQPLGTIFTPIPPQLLAAGIPRPR